MPPEDAISKNGTSSGTRDWKPSGLQLTSLALELGGEFLGRDLDVRLLLILLVLFVVWLVDHSISITKYINVTYKVKYILNSQFDILSRTKYIELRTREFLIISISSEPVDIFIIQIENLDDVAENYLALAQSSQVPHHKSLVVGHQSGSRK